MPDNSQFINSALLLPTLCYAFGLVATKSKIMREIKFRGLTDTGNWYYGGIIPHWTTGYSLITNPEGKDASCKNGTIGQFVGFIDNVGNEIFEGDIVQYDYFGDEGELQYSNMQIFWNDKTASFCYDDSYKSDKSSYQELNEEFCKDVIVVGNVHENFELLEVSEAAANEGI